jgi:hypothetical protein
MTYSDGILHKKTRPGKEFAHGLGVDQGGDGVEFVAEEQKRRAGISANLSCEALDGPDLPSTMYAKSISSVE